MTNEAPKQKKRIEVDRIACKEAAKKIDNLLASLPGGESTEARAALLMAATGMLFASYGFELELGSESFGLAVLANHETAQAIASMQGTPPATSH
ncbi:hypothetical protein FSY45_24660 [Comamonas sp. Z1]|uniref:hypothetical protein n=1 Tax=Comamonas sp. Z1 TaxID=2601246 RepID=UPI0011E638BE|nr:hypothetical protein [Comamonas sp. Z1]TYK70260.1 hypothetical protein FSY45_24660 [Comamonas sp. Z1]